MIYLKFLGDSGLSTDRGETFQGLRGGKRLALLTYLALANSTTWHRRERLIELFWPDSDPKSARNALSNMLHQIASEIGRDLFQRSGRDLLKLDPDLFSTDVLEFRKACEGAQWEIACALYHGDLLSAFHPGNTSPDFEAWLHYERRLHRQSALIATKHAALQSSIDNDSDNLISLVFKAYQLDQGHEETVIWCLETLLKHGNISEARELYKVYSAYVQQHLLTKPSLAIRNLITGYQRPDKPGQTMQSVMLTEFVSKDVRSDQVSVALRSQILSALSQSEGFQLNMPPSEPSASKDISRSSDIYEADWIIQGSVESLGENLSITLELYEVSTHMKAATSNYRGIRNGIPMEDVASEWVQLVVSTVFPDGSSNGKTFKTRSAKTRNPDAHRAYVQGCRYLDNRTTTSLGSAVKCFNTALTLDGHFAEAWVKLADAHTLTYDYRFSTERSHLSRSRDALSRALRIDPQLAEAYASLGLLSIVDKHGREAIKQLEQAIELDPNYADAYNWLSWIFLLVGRAEDALRAAQRSSFLNPLSSEGVSHLILSYLALNEDRNAIQEVERLTNLGAHYETNRFYMGIAYSNIGEYELALTVLEDLVIPWVGNGVEIARGICYANMDMTGDVNNIISQFKQEHDNFGLSMMYLVIREFPLALSSLNMVKRSEWHYWPTLAVRHIYRDPLLAIDDGSAYTDLIRKLNDIWTY